MRSARCLTPPGSGANSRSTPTRLTTPLTAPVVVGILVALPLTGLLRALLFGVTATDPVTFLFVGTALVFVAAAACYMPASRALKVEPTEALRVD